MFQKVKENQKSMIQGSRRSEIEMPRKKSGKIVIFGQGKPGKVREIHSPQVLTSLDTYTWFYNCGALFPHDFSKRKSPAARMGQFKYTQNLIQYS